MGKEKSETVYVLGGKRGWVNVKYSGVYDLHSLMGAIKAYLNNRKYNTIEVEHSEKVTPTGREVTFEIKPFRDITSYVRFNIEIIVIILRSIDILVEENGKKVKKQKGDIEFMLKASIKKNWKRSFASTKPGQFFRQTYERYITKKQLLKYEDKLEAEAQELINRVKEVLHSFRD